MMDVGVSGCGGAWFLWRCLEGVRYLALSERLLVRKESCAGKERCLFLAGFF